MVALLLIPLQVGGIEYLIYRVTGDKGPVAQVFQGTYDEAVAWADESGEEWVESTVDELIERLSAVAGAIGSISLQFVEGLGTAIVKGADQTYDYIREKLRGREPDVIAAVTVSILTLGSAYYLIHAARRGRMS